MRHQGDPSRHHSSVLFALVVLPIHPAKHTTGAQSNPLAGFSLLFEVDPRLAIVGVFVLPTASVILLREQPAHGGLQTGGFGEAQLAEDLQSLQHVRFVSVNR